MNIQSISKTDREVNITLSADELIKLCNIMHAAPEEEKEKEPFLQLYGDLIMARDLCQYGHLDDFSMKSIVKCRNGIGNGLDGVLSDDDILVLNSYLESGDIKTAFGNSDFRAIYKKIIGRHGIHISSEKIKNWMTFEEEDK